ncbi:MAG: hypothetical protein HY077_16660 [Elusimicrobia bacterium]|nr:hypothetical protein [Elusimicrobiota bacterium]
MNSARCAFVIWILSVSSAARASDPGPAAPSPTMPTTNTSFNDVDHNLAQAEMAVREVEAKAAQAGGAKGGAPCEQCQSIDGIVQQLAALPRLTEAAKGHAVRDRLTERLEAYFRCEAVVAKSPSRCEPLRPWGKGDYTANDVPYDYCFRGYLALGMFKGLAGHGPDAVKSCVDSLSDDQARGGARAMPSGAARSIPEYCAIMSKFTDPEQTCAKGAKIGAPPQALQSCREIVSLLNGQQDCEGTLDSQYKPLCPDLIAYHKALAAKNAELCGAHAACRALMGGGEKSCQPALDDVKRSCCDFYARVGPTDPLHIASPEVRADALWSGHAKGLETLLTQAHGRLVEMDAVSTRLGATAFAKEIDFREEKIADLRERWRRLNLKLHPAAPAKSPASRKK